MVHWEFQFHLSLKLELHGELCSQVIWCKEKGLWAGKKKAFLVLFSSYSESKRSFKDGFVFVDTRIFQLKHTLNFSSYNTCLHVRSYSN